MSDQKWKRKIILKTRHGRVGRRLGRRKPVEIIVSGGEREEINHMAIHDPAFRRYRDEVFEQVDIMFRADTFASDSPITGGMPPALAEGLLVLLTDKRLADALLGDLEERFHRDRMTRGLRHARLLYWSRTLASIRPLLWPAIKRLFTFVVGVVVGRTSG
jgi:hypothetical protein